jgi:hypothetical protein
MASNSVVFNGVKYYRHTSGYYRFVPTKKQRASGIKDRQMHRDVWEYHNGIIPFGYEIHHIDENPSNNEINNLAMLSSTEHKKLHGPDSGNKSAYWHKTENGKKFHSEVAKKQWANDREAKLKVALDAQPKAVEASKEWHASEQGKEWHSKHGKETWSKRKTYTKTCEVCGASFDTYWPNRGVYCGPNCCAKAFRKRAKSI